MRFGKTKLLAVAGMAFVLAACGSSVDKKTATELLQESSQHLYSKESKYNFDAKLAVDLSESNNLNTYMSELDINFVGAVDAAAGKFEVTPSVKAGMFNLTLPLALNTKDVSILVEPSNIIDSLGIFIPYESQSLAKFKNKYLLFKASNFLNDEEEQAEFKEIQASIHEVVNLFPGALEFYNKQIPVTNLNKLELTAEDKSLKAKSKIELVLTGEEIETLQKEVSNYFLEQVQASDKFNPEFKSNLVEALGEFVNLDADYGTYVESSRSVIWLDAKSRPIQSEETFTLYVEDEEFTIVITSKYSNFGKPKFVIKPAATDIYTVTEEDIDELL